MGFVVSGIVIDIGMMNRIFSALVSFLVTVVPIILALTPSTGISEIGTNACSLTANEIAVIQSGMMSRNETCSYNMTLNEILSM